MAHGFSAAEYAALLLRLAARDRAVGLAISHVNELESRLRSIVDPRCSRKPVSRATVGIISAVAIVMATTVAAVTLALPVDDPLSERLPVVVEATAVVTAATAEDAALMRILTEGTRKSKTWEGDLVSERARWALSRARGGELLQPLREALADRDWRVRAYAAWSLAQVGDRASVPRLTELLDDPNWRMRAMAAFALHAAADPRSAEAMLSARSDQAWQVRIEVAAYLGALHDPRYYPILKKMSADRHVAVRSAAEEALNQ
jgi:hypothetical protein